MPHTIHSENVHRVDSLFGDLQFCFLSETSFRLSQLSATDSACVDEIDAIKAERVECDENHVVFQRGPLCVSLSEKSLLRVVHNGNNVLELIPYAGQRQFGNFELAKAEGHHVGDQGEYRGGFAIKNDCPVYGLGEKTGPLDKRGYDYINWNTDDPSAHVDTFKSLYQSIPFFILFNGDQSVGIFLDNTGKTHFDFNKTEPDAVFVQWVDSVLDLYVFVGSMDQVIAQYTALTGRNPLFPYWALGAQQCRWSYPDSQTVDAVIEGYRKCDIPLSCVYLDIDYMDCYKDFTVDPNKFPNIAQWLEEKSKDGIRVVPIIDAGVKAEPGYRIYDEGMDQGFFSTLNGDVYHNEVWPGDSVFPAFVDERVQRWWAKHIKEFLDLGFAGIWNDMNEPASFRGPLPLEVSMGKGLEHRLAHNIYGHLMAKSGAEGFKLANKRIFQLTRAGYAGTCRFSGSWAGDNQSIYDHLRLSLPQMMNMSVSGQAYLGVDIGGFGGDCTDELLTRWATAAILFPLYRNHSSLGTKNQEPYLLKEPFLSAYRAAVMARYEILPILYDELYFAEAIGTIPLRPLVYNYPDDPRVRNENTQIMLGKDVMLAPSLFPGQEKRSCYFPEPYVHFRTGQRYEKGDHLIDVGVGDIPLFFRERGTLILSPIGNAKAEPPSVLRIRCGLNSEPTLHFEDSGDGLDYRRGAYNLYCIQVLGDDVEIVALHHGMDSHYQSVVLEKWDGGSVELPFKMVDKI